MLLALKAIAPQIRQNLGCKIFALLRPLIACPAAKYCYALPLRSWPASFCRISGEAVLLTGVVYGIFTSASSQFVFARSQVVGGVLVATWQSRSHARRPVRVCYCS
jgi:hypothetical protein